MTDADPLEGQTLVMLNQLLAKAWPAAKAGDAKAADQVIKILQIKQARLKLIAPPDTSWRL
ncbi:MAG: hypothetical protein Q7O66_06735 [Dehalococcoidia bacterium]|nr:hypothetical protein [Dehalococcoidia bacterium]